MTLFSKKYLSLLVIGSISAISGCAPNSTAQDYTDMVHDLTGGLITVKSTKDQGTDPTYKIYNTTEITYNQPIKINENISVDIDLAASRIKRYYNFSSTEDLNNHRNSVKTNGKWIAASIESNGFQWEAVPGTYYKMGKKANNDIVTIELEKDGNTTTLFINYLIASDSSETKYSIESLFAQIKDVAEGKIR